MSRWRRFLDILHDYGVLVRLMWWNSMVVLGLWLQHHLGHLTAKASRRAMRLMFPGVMRIVDRDDEARRDGM